MSEGPARTISYDATDLQRRLNANIIAAKVIRRAEVRTCALLIFPDGTAKTVPLEADRLDPMLARNPLSLVGTYDASATLEDVASDVLAMAWSMSDESAD